MCVTFFACFLLHNIQCNRLCNIIKSLLVDQDISTFGITKPNVLGSSTGYVFFFFFEAPMSLSSMIYMQGLLFFDCYIMPM